MWRTRWMFLLFRLQPTYEELKQACIAISVISILCLQPTYEELKLLLLFVPAQGHRSPAYLWGIETWMTMYLLWWTCLSPAYLWGIETDFWRFWKEGPGWSPAYLWGIETILRRLILWPLFRVSSLPMRNWNGSLTFTAGKLTKVSSLPMRNWNHYKRWKTGTWRTVSSLPMRNWNSSTIL